MKTFIAASAFMSDEHLNQSSLVEKVAQGGADGIEIREELFEREPGDEYLQSLRDQCLVHSLEVNYSAPEPLFKPDASLNTKVDDVLRRANRLGARLVKFILGDALLNKVETETLHKLKDLTEEYAGIQITVENDQTKSGGTVHRLEEFFALCQARGIPIGMTFDLGNWFWTGEDPVQAALHLKDYVDYIHVKSADTRTVPPQSRELTLDSSRDKTLTEALAILPSSCSRCIEYSLTDYTPALIRHRVDALRSFQKGLLV